MRLGKDIILTDNGESKLGGRNVGVHPIHRFTPYAKFADEGGWPLKTTSYGYCEWVAGCLRFRENSNVCSVELVTKGEFAFTQDGRSYHVGPGELFITKLGKDSEMEVVRGHAVKRVLILEGHCLRSILAAAGLEDVDVVRPKEPAAAKALFDDAERCLRNASPANLRRASGTALELIMLLGAESKGGGMHPALRKALDIMDSRLRGTLSIGELRRRCSCSPMTLHRLFKDRFGKPPMEYFIETKMEIARDMLVHSEMPVKEVAAQLGYSSPLYFSSEFRKRLGASPSKFRKASAP